MNWDQIDWDAKTWTIPANLMKTKREFKVALSSSAIAVLQEMPRISDYVFPGGKSDQPMSENAMLKLLERMKTKKTSLCMASEAPSVIGSAKKLSLTSIG